MKRILFIPVLCILIFAPLWGESNITTKLELYDSVSRMGSSTWANGGLGFLTVSFNQINNRNVKSQVKISAAIDPATAGKFTFSIPRAYVKFRFPDFRVVIGKAPFSWGEGLIFNTGDILFGGSAPSTNLMQSKFSDSTTWMTSINYPLGPFSYLEGIVLPPATITGGLGATKTGARFVTKLGTVKLESGYLYDGSIQTHKPYVSFQGNLLLNWHLSAVAFFSRENSFINSIKNSLVITAGVYSMTSIGYDGILNYRVEAQIKPYGKWAEPASPMQPGSYGFYLYPEVSYTFNSGMALMMRGFVSPVDRSAVAIPGFSWNVFQGFTFITMATFEIGDRGDTYSWRPESPLKSGFSLLTGISVVY